jgi:hypothetical protein
MSFTFVPNPRGAENITRSEPWARHLLAITAEVAAAAKVAFEMQGPHPYAVPTPAHPTGGDYVTLIQPSVLLEHGEFVGRVVAFDEASWYIEVGTSDTPTFAPLRLGADMVGLNLVAVARRDRA